jgi:signal transduction histidine kinase
MRTFLHLMDMASPPRRTYLLFGSLTVYILLQFTWWAILLVRKENELADLAMELKLLGGDPDHPMNASRALQMVIGEGSVFLLFLMLVLFLTFRAIRRDLSMARTQRNFQMAVTHELRTPIAAIKLQLQTLSRSGLNSEQRELLHKQALQEADRLNLLADKVLLANSTDEGILALDLKEVEVMELLRNVVERARVQLAPNHRVELNGPDRFTALTDPQALRSIADNLIENAAKYAPEGTRIGIEVIKGKEGWRLLVSDEGPGVAPGDVDRIFERFYRGGNEETRQAKGTGLGLYIVQRLAERLGGDVQLRKGVPHGAIFAVSFPDR